MARSLLLLHVLSGSVGRPGGVNPNSWDKFVPKPSHNPPPLERWNEIDTRIETWTCQQTPQHAMEILQQDGVPAGRVLDCEAIHRDPQLLARSYWVELPHPRQAPWKQPSSSWRLVEANPQLRQPAPLFGQHNTEILSGLLGRSEEELDQLRQAGIIADAPIDPRPG